MDLAAESAPAGAAGDSIAVAGATIVSRVTGVARFAAIGAVLGPTFFANTYQLTNSLPNLVYYGFLGGSLFSSLLVPSLVRHIDAGDRRACERIAGGFLGLTLLALGCVAPLAVLAAPYALAFGHGGQSGTGRLLILMFVPQIFGYGIVGTATAVMNARRRFLLAAAAPALENVGTLAVLGAVALLYGTGNRDVPTGELVLLGLGTTGAVLLHAAVQWWGARRAGVTLLPRAGWREPEVRGIVRRSLASLGQAGLVALQTLTLLMVANRVAGGVVAFQLGLNFYALAIALAAQPVALSLLPRLSRMHERGDLPLFRDTLARGVSLGLFVAVPAAVGYLVLAGPLAHAVTFGRMGSEAGVTMVSMSLAGIAVAVVGETVFMISTYAWYAGKDTRSPLYSMLLQAVICLGLAAAASRLSGVAVLFGLGVALTVASLVSSSHLSVRLWRALPSGAERLAPSVAKVVAGAVLLAGPAWLTARLLGPHVGTPATLAASITAGAGTYLAVQALWRAPELRWLAGGLRYLRGSGRAVTTPEGARADG